MKTIRPWLLLVFLMPFPSFADIECSFTNIRINDDPLNTVIYGYLGADHVSLQINNFIAKEEARASMREMAIHAQKTREALTINFGRQLRDCKQLVMRPRYGGQTYDLDMDTTLRRERRNAQTELQRSGFNLNDYQSTGPIAR